jgi:perosamine synthetase
LHEPELKGREIEYLSRCIETGWVSYAGEYVTRFEADLARVSQVAHAVAMVNGTVALHAALLVAGVKPGDEVLVPALTFAATANAVVHAGAEPHFVDSELLTLGLDPDKLAVHLEAAATVRDGVCVNRATGRPIRAVVPVHVFGHPAHMRALQDVAERYRLAIVEDAAEALGSRMNNKPVGGDGVMSVLSFNGNKIVTTGGGGAILTNDADLARRIKHLTTTAKVPHRYDFFHDEVGYNYRMPNINAAVGCAQLERLDDFVARKRRLAEAFATALSAVGGVRFFREPPGAASNYWLNAFLLDPAYATERNPLLEELNDAGLGCRPAWIPIHQLPMFSQCPRGDLATAEDIAMRLINVPSSAHLAPPK